MGEKVLQWKRPLSLKSLKDGEAAEIRWPDEALEANPKWLQGHLRIAWIDVWDGEQTKTKKHRFFWFGTRHGRQVEIELTSPSQVRVMRP